MKNEKKSKIILKILNKTYPKVPIPLNYKNIFTLLISVLLSAQCTDVNVNNVTKNIYPRLDFSEKGEGVTESMFSLSPPTRNEPICVLGLCELLA